MNNSNILDVRMSPPRSVSPRAGAAILVILLPALLVLEFSSGAAFSLHVFYLVPVSLAAWNFGSRVGCAVATVAAGYCVFVALAMRPPPAPFLPLLWQAASTLLLFEIFALAIAHHRAFIDAVLAASRIDFESGALSAREFERSLEAEARRARRYARPLSVVMLEIASDARDSKHVAAIADTLRRSVRECDLVGRLTPRRFAIALVECPVAEATRIAARCREALAILPGAPRTALGAVSYGGSSPTTASQLLHIAESDMTSNRAGMASPLALPQIA